MNRTLIVLGVALTIAGLSWPAVSVIAWLLRR
jgi:hypothetical protein